ncbi:hypothetical protein SK571_08885 [Lentzea sp. BCCO 10_0798]|uniref:Uncharacterized protein n=1 Tax=Lentzea kristufekii TaxID=3095430 RepID=A0ABU4TMH9_9PSEU|nr:hypothetical protein [Lentzea sp. BCCO 10_0798]MDX8049491.1 hypothetical protein [Lentzea sp. BCCO 10_0798]
MRTSVRTPDAGTVEEVLKLAARAPSFGIVPPWRWRNGNECLELVTTRTDQTALLACGAVLHHMRVALSAMGWDCHVLRSPQPDGQVASVHPRWELDPFSCEVASAAAISLRRADPRPYLGDEVPDSALTWLLHAAHAENCELELVARRSGVLLRMLGHDWLSVGEAVSAVLLASTVWGLASQPLLHEGEVLVRVGWQSPNAEPLPQSAR